MSQVNRLAKGGRIDRSQDDPAAVGLRDDHPLLGEERIDRIAVARSDEGLRLRPAGGHP